MTRASLGELEITFLQAFCRAGNLRGMLDTPEIFPEQLRPYILHLKEMYEPVAFTSKFLADPLKTDSLSSQECRQLVERLNAKSQETRWAVASDWCRLNKADKKKTASLSSRCQPHKHLDYKNVTFSNWKANMNNSVIAVDSALPNIVHFARIERIFTHTRTTKTKQEITDTWLTVKPFPPIKKKKDDVFDHLNQRALQLHLRLPVSNDVHMININDVVSHCAWIEYNAGELVSRIDYPVVALVSLDRE
jgi:hypothetical protein